MGFEAHDRYLYELFNRNKYYIPRNQRRYVWTERNWEELFDDIMLINSGYEATHFIGSIVLYRGKDRENGISHYTIIDGQQRITTLAILLASVAFWLKCYGADDEFNGTKQYILARDDTDKDHIMVTSEYHVSLGRILNGIIYSDIKQLKRQNVDSFLNAYTIGNKDKNIADAFKYFLEALRSFVDKSEKKPVNSLVELRDAIVNRVTYVSIIASSEEDACTVFEILNARGSVLEDHELLKNFIMRGIKPEGDIDQAKIIWNEIESDLGNNIGRFVKHYATHRYRPSAQSGASDYKTIQKANKGCSTEDLLYDIRTKATYYNRLVNPIIDGEKANCTQKEYMIYSFFKKRRHEQIRPVLLSLIHQREQNLLSVEKYEETILFLYDFIVCYNIIGQENSNKITNIVYSMAYSLENNYSDENLQEFITKLKGKLPEKDSFYSAFSLIGWSHHGGFYDDSKDKDRVKIVLEVLERIKSPSKNCDEFTIEHILDDSAGVKNGKIGNLIPLEESLNSLAKGKSFQEKLAIYSQSSFQTARNVAARYSNGNFNIDTRTKAIAYDLYKSILQFKIETTKQQKTPADQKNKPRAERTTSPTIGEIVDGKKSSRNDATSSVNVQPSLFDLPTVR